VKTPFTPGVRPVTFRILAADGEHAAPDQDAHSEEVCR
jgi:hypothetical protein